jgi:mono/diheme cytochrome c family protein
MLMHLRHAAAGLLLAALLAAGGGTTGTAADEAAQPAVTDQATQPATSDQATQPAPADQATQPAPADQAAQPVPTEEESAWAGGDPAHGQQIFASNGCGWCHEGSGRKPGRGPQLMDTTRDDDFLALRISNGSPGRMPAFGSSLDDQAISDLIAFIHSIKPEAP